MFIACVRFALISTLLSFTWSSGIALAQDEKKVKRLSAAEYLEALQTSQVIEKEEDDYTLKVTLIPDVHLLAMAKSFHEAKLSGLDEMETEKKLRQLHSKIRKDRGKVLFKVEFDFYGGKRHFFLEKKWKQCCEVRLKNKRSSCKVLNEEPRPIYNRWQIFELNSHNKFKKKLARLEESKFEVLSSAKRKSDDKSPIELTLKDLRRYIEVPKRNEYERIGINVAVKQIALANWQETALPPISVKFFPGTWKLPRGPEELEGLLPLLD